jgi:hypothetical protein
MRGRIRATLRTSITLTADADVDIAGRILTRSPTIDRGVVTVTAGGRIALTGTINNASTLTLGAAGDVDLGGSLITRTKIGRATVDAGGMLVAHAFVRLPIYDLALHGAAGVRVDRAIDVRPAGFLEIASAAGDVSINMPIRANKPSYVGTAVSIAAGGNVAVNALVSASGTTGWAGSIVISSPGGDVALAADVEALGGKGGNQGFPGGSLHVSAGGDVVVGGDVRVNALPGTDAPGGSVRVDGATVQVSSAATIDADGGPGGPFSLSPEMRFTTTGGTLVLSGTFFARGGPSVIQGTSSGDLIADGQFRCLPDGCIGLDATGTLDVSGGSFDEPIVTTCP